MKDFLGREIQIDDKVVFMAPGYRNLVIGTVIKITPQFVRIAYMNTWNYSGEGNYCEIRQGSDQIVKI
jgi:hypothetical protein